jgi:hypothetical protein
MIYRNLKLPAASVFLPAIVSWVLAADAVAVELVTPGGWVNAHARLNNPGRNNSHPLANGGYYGSLVHVRGSGLSLAESYSKLIYTHGGNGDSSDFIFKTKASPSNNYNSGYAKIYTSSIKGGNLEPIPVQVKRSVYDEYNGKPVTVTIKISVVSTNGRSGLSRNFAGVWINGSPVMNKYYYYEDRETKRYTRTVTLRSRIGSSFSIAIAGSSEGLRRSSNLFATGELELTVDMSVQ